MPCNSVLWSTRVTSCISRASAHSCALTFLIDNFSLKLFSEDQTSHQPTRCPLAHFTQPVPNGVHYLSFFPHHQAHFSEVPSLCSGHGQSLSSILDLCHTQIQAVSQSCHLCLSHKSLTCLLSPFPQQGPTKPQ